MGNGRLLYMFLKVQEGRRLIFEVFTAFQEILHIHTVCLQGLEPLEVQLRIEGFFCFSHIFNEILQYIEIWNEFKVEN